MKHPLFQLAKSKGKVEEALEWVLESYDHNTVYAALANDLHPEKVSIEQHNEAKRNILYKLCDGTGASGKEVTNYLIQSENQHRATELRMLRRME